VTYARLGILTSVVCFISGILLHTDLSILLFSYLLFTILVMLLLYTHWLYARAPSSFSYTLIGSLSDDPGFTRLDSKCFTSLIRRSLSLYGSWGVWSFSLPILIFLSSYYPCGFYSFLDSIYISNSLSFYSLIIILCGQLYVYCSDRDLL